MMFRVVLGALLGIAALSFFVRGTIAAQTEKSQWDGVYTDAQAHRGDLSYTQYCLVCHGSDLMGGEAAPPLIGGAFQSNWNELSLGDLFERIRISMPLNAPSSLSRQQYADILSYILAKSGYPSGKTELPTQTEALKDTKFLAQKP